MFLGRSWGALGRSWPSLGHPGSIFDSQRVDFEPPGLDLGRFWSFRDSLLSSVGISRLILQLPQKNINFLLISRFVLQFMQCNAGR